jgi:hypothetical protein
MELRFVVWGALGLVACGGHGTERGAAPPASSGRPSLGDPIAGTTVYDDQGQARACEPPRPGCSTSGGTSDFRDECRLKGFRIVRCGCDDVCTGKVTQRKSAYDSNNQPKPCAAPQPDCSPPDTSAAFQDACTESGHRFVVCGCEWLCSGPLKQSGSAAPPTSPNE